MNRIILVRVEIPALDSLIAYLREQSANQAKIDTLAAQVESLTAHLKQSSGHLNDAVNANS